MHFYTLGLLTFLLCIGIVVCQEEDFTGTEPGSDCLCVPYYQCKNGTINEHGAGLINPRKLPGSYSQEAVNEEAPVSCGEYHVCCNKFNQNTNERRGQRCGIRRQRVDYRVGSRSSQTTFGEWPWQGTLLLPGEGTNALFQCAGVLIDNRHALTVAHCVSKFRNVQSSSLFMRLGLWDAKNEDNRIPYIDVTISDIKIHPGYEEGTLIDDIALLTFSKPVRFASHVDRICLPYADEIHDNDMCVVTGWGKSTWVGSKYSRYLKQTEVPVLNHTQCETQLRKTRLGSYFKLHKNFMCAGGNEKADACKGDGGGPLACPRSDGTYGLVGLVSWGIGCGEAGHPGVYVSVSKYLDWISTLTKKPVEFYWPRSNDKK